MGKHKQTGFTPASWHSFFACSQLTQEEVRAHGVAKEQRRREEMEQERRRRHRAQKEQLEGLMIGKAAGQPFTGAHTGPDSRQCISAVSSAMCNGSTCRERLDGWMDGWMDR